MNLAEQKPPGMTLGRAPGILAAPRQRGAVGMTNTRWTELELTALQLTVDEFVAWCARYGVPCAEAAVVVAKTRRLTADHAQGVVERRWPAEVMP